MPFRQITGHRHLLELLARASARRSLPPSLIFAGPGGVGKRTTAIALAQALNCEHPVRWPAAPSQSDANSPDGRGSNDACGACAACRRIARGVHADVMVLEPGETGAIKVDQVRDAIERSAYRPFEGRTRVVIVDEADALLPEAQNALLKTLEEPPSASVFVLITSRPDLLLPTVRSRCQRLRFGPLSAADVADVLVREHDMSAADAHAAAAASDGSIGGALEGSADAAVEAREVAAHLLERAAATTDPRRRLEGAKLLAGGSGTRDELALRLRALSSLVRDLGVLLARADAHVLANVDLVERLLKLPRSFDGDRVVRAFSAIDHALSALEHNASPKIVSDWVALQL